MNFFEKHVSIGSFEFPKLRVMRDCMPMWSACQRACVPTWFMCQCACIPAWFTCQPVCVPTCQKRANFSFLHVNVLMNVPIFQTFLLWNAKGNLYTLFLYKKFYIILDMILIHMCICITDKSCIILHFCTSCHLKEKCGIFAFWNFFAV